MEGALAIVNALNQQGFAAYLVGGCVRDMLLGRTPNDWDIASSARPEEVKALFPRTVDTGIAHGTVTVLMDGRPYEVTTFRTEGPYRDHRRPESVCFVGSLQADLARRDFTINAMAYHPKEGVVDDFGGRRDLEQGVIRTVGDSETRFREDALRLLRAARFSAQLGFSLAKETREGMERAAPLLSSVSAERVREELCKLLLSPHPETVELLEETGLLPVVLPEVSRLFGANQNTPYHCYDVGRHTMVVLQNVPSKLPLRLAALLHDVGKPACKTTDGAGVDHFKGHPEKSEELARGILRRLRFDKKTIGQVLPLIRWHDYRFPATEKAVRRAMATVGDGVSFEELLLLKEADAKGKNPDNLEQNLEEIRLIVKCYREIVQKGQAVSVKDLAIGGRELLELGFVPGEQIGKALAFLLQAVLDDPKKNKRDILLTMAQTILRTQSKPMNPERQS